MASPSDAQDKKNTGWLSKIFGKDRHTDNTNARELANESTSHDVPALKIEALLESVNNASQHVRNFYVTFLLTGFYIATIIWSTTDVMLLKETPIRLPILDVELPITGFYRFAPFFYLLLHFNLLLQLSLLAGKIHRFDDAVAELSEASEREYYYTRLFSFTFTQALSGRQHLWFLKFLLTLMVWITIIWLPLGLLTGLQMGFLAYHSESVLFWQRFAIGLDLVFLAIFWSIIRSRDGNGLVWFMRASGMTLIRSWIILWLPISTTLKQSRIFLILTQHNHTKSSGRPLFEGSLGLITLTLVIVFSWGVAVLPDSDHEKWIASWIRNTNGTPDSWLTDKSLGADGKPYFRLTEWLFDQTYLEDNLGKTQTRNSIFNRNLRIREQLLIANELNPEDQAVLVDSIHLRERILNTKEPISEDLLNLVNTNKIKVQEVLSRTVGLNLRGRDFRYADFTESLLPKADFREINGEPTNFNNAKFNNALLIGALMIEAELKNTNLRKANLQDADLNGANLQGANLINAVLLNTQLSSADLRGAKLYDAKLQNANLHKANLQGANLNFATLQGTDLSEAKLQGTELNNTNLQGAKLNGSYLQNAKLSNANLQNTDLNGAYLLRAKLKNASFQGAKLNNTNLQGADLRKAYLQGTNLNFADLQGADLRGANLQGAQLSTFLFGAQLASAKLQGAKLNGAYLQGTNLNKAELQGADLREAKLQGALLANANLTLSIISDAQFNPATEQESKLLRNKISNRINDTELRNQVQKTLAERKRKPTTLAEATGKHILADEPYGDVVHTTLYGFGNKLNAVENETEYQNKLSSYLIELSCQDQWIATGIINHRIEYGSFGSSLSQRLLSLKNQKNQSEEHVCPALSEIDANTIRKLERIAKKKKSNDPIQPTFE